MNYNKLLQFINDNGKATYKPSGVYFDRDEVVRLIDLYINTVKPNTILEYQPMRPNPVFKSGLIYQINGIDVKYAGFDKERGLYIFNDGTEEIRVSIFSKEFVYKIYRSEK